MKKNFSLYGLPEEVKFCQSCVISNKDLIPTLVKNVDNKKLEFVLTRQCEACKYAKIKEKIDWEKRKRTLKFYLKKKNGCGYVVPGRG